MRKSRLGGQGAWFPVQTPQERQRGTQADCRAEGLVCGHLAGAQHRDGVLPCPGGAGLGSLLELGFWPRYTLLGWWSRSRGWNTAQVSTGPLQSHHM